MSDDFERCYRAVSSRDRRFDGWFITAVTSTGIYCRPSCPAMTPRREHLRFYASAAAAQGAGFRACKRCLPDATPGSPEWNVRADVVGRAMRLIADGVVDREGVPGLARRLGYSARQLQRHLVAEVGAGPLALARAQRVQTARTLIETTSVPFTQVAFAAGFASIRQFNDSVQAVFASTPGELRRAAARRAPAPAESLVLRLPYRAPCDVEGTLAFLAARAVPGVEQFESGVYRRSLRLPYATAVVALAPADGHVRCELRLDDLRDLTAAVQRCRRLLDLDADPQAVDGQLGADPLLGRLVAGAPGRRSPGTVDGAELALRAVLGQQVSVAAARTLAARLVVACGKPLTTPSGEVTHLFPAPEALAALDPGQLAMPRSRRRALQSVARLLADGALDLDAGADREHATAALASVPGVGVWTADYVRMRALGDPDVFLATDLGVRRALADLCPSAGAITMPGPASAGGQWRPWRSYAVHHLWASLHAPAADPPADPQVRLAATRGA